MKKQDLRIIKTQQSLIEAFTFLLNTKEFEQISVKELCDRAMIRRSTFYRHYSDKFQLLNDMIESVLNETRKRHSYNIEGTGLDRFIENYINDILIYINKNKELINNIISHYLYDQTTFIIYNQIYKAVCNQTSYEIHTGSYINVNTKTYNEFLTGGILSVVLNWVRNKNDNRTINSIKSDITKLISNLRTAHLIEKK